MSGIVGEVTAELGEGDGLVYLLSALNVLDAWATPETSAGGLIASGSAGPLGPVPRRSTADSASRPRAGLAGARFREGVKALSNADRLARLAEYLDLCQSIPSLTVEEYFEATAPEPGPSPSPAPPPAGGPAEAPAAPPPPGPPAPPAGPTKADASHRVEFEEAPVRAAGGAGEPWRFREEIEPGLWFQLVLEGRPGDWFLDARLSLDEAGEKIAADYPAQRGDRVYGTYKFFEGQRWVTVETGPPTAVCETDGCEPEAAGEIGPDAS